MGDRWLGQNSRDRPRRSGSHHWSIAQQVEQAPAAPDGRCRCRGNRRVPFHALRRGVGFVLPILRVYGHGFGFVLRISMTSDRGTAENHEHHRRDQSAVKRQPGTRDVRNLRVGGFVLHFPAVDLRVGGFVLHFPAVDRRVGGFVLPIPFIDRRVGGFVFRIPAIYEWGRGFVFRIPAIERRDHGTRNIHDGTRRCLRLCGLYGLCGERIVSACRDQAGAADLDQGVKAPEQRPAARKLVAAEAFSLIASVERQPGRLLGRVGFRLLR